MARPRGAGVGETSRRQGPLWGDPAPGSVREPAAPGSPHPSSPAPAWPGRPSPRPAPPADLSRRPGPGPPGGRARGRRAPGEQLPRAPPSRRTSFPWRAGTRRAAQVAPRPPGISRARSAPPRPGRLGPRRRPPGRLPAAAAPRQWSGSWSRRVGGSERGTWAAPPPRRVLVPYGSPGPERPLRTRSRRRPLPWGLNHGGDPPLPRGIRCVRFACLSEAPARGGNGHFLCLTPAPRATHL